MKRSILLILLFALNVFACKKDEEPQQTITQRLQHKWSVDTYIYNDHVNGTDNITTENGTATDFVDFRTDGKVYSQFAMISDTAAYSVQADDKY